MVQQSSTSATERARFTFPPLAFMLGVVQAVGGLGYCFVMGDFAAPGTDWAVALWPLLYLGAVCSFVALSTLQCAAAHFCDVCGTYHDAGGLFGSVFSVLIGFEPLSAQLFVGGVLIMLSIVFAEADFPL